MTCRSGVVSVAIVVSTARTTASVLTPEPNTLRARTGWSGRVLYARVGARYVSSACRVRAGCVPGACRVRAGCVPSDGYEARITCGVWSCEVRVARGGSCRVVACGVCTVWWGCAPLGLRPRGVRKRCAVRYASLGVYSCNAGQRCAVGS